MAAEGFNAWRFEAACRRRYFAIAADANRNDGGEKS